MSFTRPWEGIHPAGTEAASLGDNRIRNLKTELGERLEDMLYGFNTTTTTGHEDLYGIKKLRFRELAADPTIIDTDNEAFLYTKNVGNVSELFYKNNADAVRQITSAGKINILAGDYPANSIDEDDIELDNDSYLTAANAAGDGTVNLIKAGSNDLATLPDGAEMASNAAPVEDEAIANKKCVDDSIAAALPDDDAFGSWEVNPTGYATNVLATSDGFVVAMNTTENIELSGYTDGNSPPTTKRCTNTHSPGDKTSSFTMPVKKGDRWKVTNSTSRFWIPIGG